MERFYEAPQAASPQELTLMDRFSDSLALAKRWMIVFQVMFVLGLIICFGLGLSFLGSGLTNHEFRTGARGGIFLCLGIFCTLYLMPVLNARKKAAEYLQKPSVDQLGVYLEANARMWKVWGMATLVCIGMYLLWTIGVGVFLLYSFLVYSA